MNDGKVRILVPPGIGDIYWVLVKLRAFLKREGITGRPEITAVSYEMPDGIHLRGTHYLKLFDWLDVADPPTVPNDPELQPIWDEAYSGPGRSIFPGVMGFDYFIAYNGRINSGGLIEDDDLACDWDIHKLDLEARAAQWKESIGGRYAVHFWPFYGSYASHLEQFGLDDIVASIKGMPEMKHVFIGAAWERELNPIIFEMMRRMPGCIDLIGETELLGTLQLMSGADVIVGYHAGMTNLAAALGMKTVLIWDDRYPESTSIACVPPKTRGTNYIPVQAKGLTRTKLTNILCEHLKS